MEKKLEYTNGEVTIEWRPDICIHSANCVKGNPALFNTQRKPWVDPKAASSEEIIRVVSNCPSGALKVRKNADTISPNNKETIAPDAEVHLTENGPLMVKGGFKFFDSTGKEIEKKEKVFLCRCGHSSKKPFCDGSHKTHNFVG